MAKPRIGQSDGRLAPPQIAPSTLKAVDALGDMWASVEAARIKLGFVIAARPPNSFTISEYQDKFGLSSSTAKLQIREAVKAGTLTMSFAYVPNSVGNLVKTQVYCVVD